MHSSSHFKRNIFLGTLVGSGLLALFSTRRGREIREKIASGAEEVYESIQDKIKDLSDYTQDHYNALVEVVAAQYAAARSWPAAMTTAIVRELKKRWWALQVYLLYQEIRSAVANMSDLSKKEYEKLVQDVVEAYSEKKELVNTAKRKLLSALKKKWDEIEV